MPEGAFLWGGGFWLVLTLAITVAALWWAAERAPYDFELWPDEEDTFPEEWERNARTSLYSLRSFERRVENVVPRDDA